MSPDKLLEHRISRYSILLSNPTLKMSIPTSTRSNGSIKPLRGKENYITWSIEIENILLRNNNAACIRKGSRAVRALEPDIWTTITSNLSNTTKTSKHIMLQQLQLKLLLDKLLLDRKLLVNEDEPLYALHFPKSPTKQKDVIESIHYTLRPLIQNH
jgi:hypothetical protein